MKILKDLENMRFIDLGERKGVVCKRLFLRIGILPTLEFLFARTLSFGENKVWNIGKFTQHNPLLFGVLFLNRDYYGVSDCLSLCSSPSLHLLPVVLCVLLIFWNRVKKRLKKMELECWVNERESCLVFYKTKLRFLKWRLNFQGLVSFQIVLD